ncbi:Integrating conjugative element relaxase, PFL4751 [Aromatoleum bremense]|nr:Integrating conjugative element relaxase, PFL4751 [Aromatoleum bremense]
MLAVLAVGCFLAAAGLGAWLLWPVTGKMAAYRTAAGSRRSTPASRSTIAVGDAHRLAANRHGWLRVLDVAALIDVCHLAGALQQIQRESKLGNLAWERDIAPAMQQYLRFVQLLPASEAHHHAHLGGLAAHTIEVVYAAVCLRNGYLLPRGGAAEQIDAQRDHWTYAVIFAALLHDIGKPITDLRVSLADRPDGPARPWLPMSGDMVTAGAEEYEVRFAPAAERNYAAHRRLPQVLAPRIVPATALAFLAREPAVMRELDAVLSGDDASSVLTGIVRGADQRSAASNLQQGPRNQFGSATAVPLVERLMEAMRRLLRQGGLPLNRDGAAGWVAEGAAWFVAKRLADAVREEISRTDPDCADSVPGPSKNDRLFDTWQDYGLLERNPDTGQAIWYVEIRGSGYGHEFAMLKFPLATLFDRPEDYPPAFDGAIVVKAPRHAREKSDSDEPKAAEPGDPGRNRDKESGQRSSTTRKELDVPPPRPAHAASPPTGFNEPRRATPRPSPPNAVPASAAIEDDYLSEDDSAAAASDAATRVGAPRPALLPASRPVTPFAHVPGSPRKGARSEASDAPEPGDAALLFMAWLQQGIADGSIPYNEAGAPVHFVPEGMALVSPRTFRDFATLYGDDGNGPVRASGVNDKPGSGIQRQVIKARWHVVGAGNSNVHHYTVLGRGGKPVGKLAAVVIKHPERWINPVPLPNPNIVTFSENLARPAREG